MNFCEQVLHLDTLAANVRVRCSDFSTLRVYAVYSNRHPPSLFGEHCANFAMVDFEENVEEMVGTTREAAGDDRVRRGRDQGRDRRPRERDRRQDGDDGW